jgi:uncharacterized sulfatase
MSINLASLAVLLLAPVAMAGERPNILLFLADDMTYTDPGPYGNKRVKTPNLDKLASEGMRFSHCFTATAMCAPTRQQLYTGVYPVRNGAYANHAHVKKGTRSLFTHLKERGYRVALIGKKHVGPKSSFPFKFLGGRHHDGGKGNDLPLKNAEAFVNSNQDQPWFLVVASNQPHRPWNRGDPDAYDPDELDVPPYLVDMPATRRAMTRYYAEITYMDKQVGRVRSILESAGQMNETLFLFTSEQGSNFPHCKWTLYDTGIRTQLIARWPEHIEVGTTTDALVEYVDVVPTLMEAAGADPKQLSTGLPGGPAGGEGFDGSSFLPVLLGEQHEHGRYAFGVHTTRGIFRGQAYPIRSIRSDRYKLILNLNHESTFQNLVTERWGLFNKWREAAENNDHAAQLVNHYQKRPAVEFYDLKNDPYELNNLAQKDQHQQRIKRLRGRLKEWMQQQGDKGMKTEMKAPKR